MEDYTVFLGDLLSQFIPRGKDEAYYFAKFRALVDSVGLRCHKKTAKGGLPCQPVTLDSPDSHPTLVGIERDRCDSLQNRGRPSLLPQGAGKKPLKAAVRPTVYVRKVVPAPLPKVLTPQELYEIQMKEMIRKFREKEAAGAVQLIYDPFKPSPYESQKPKGKGKKVSSFETWSQSWEDEYKVKEVPLHNCDGSLDSCPRNLRDPLKFKKIAAPTRAHMEVHWKQDLRDLRSFYSRCPDKSRYSGVPQYVWDAYAKACKVDVGTIIKWSKR